MAKIEDVLIPSLNLDEVAAPATPAATSVVVYAKSDGLVYSKDDAGAETLMSSGSTAVATDAIWDAAGDLAVGSGANTASRLAIGNAGGVLARINGAVAWNAGTAFPTAATGDRFFRTDRGIEYYYDGTRWLSVTLYHTPFSGSDRGSATVTVTTSNYAIATIIEDLYDIYLVDYCWQINVAATNNATHFWRWRLQKLEATGTTGTVITSPDSSALATGWFSGRTAINAVHTDVGSLRTNAEVNGTPGAFYGVFAVTWRMVG